MLARGEGWVMEKEKLCGDEREILLRRKLEVDGCRDRGRSANLKERVLKKGRGGG